MTKRSGWLLRWFNGPQWLSFLCLSAGAVLFGMWAIPTGCGLVFSRLAISRFQMEHPEAKSWAPGRIAAYRKAMRVVAPAPEAVLRIPRLGLRVPVMEGSSEGASALAMNLGAEHIAGTAEPGGRGNMALTSHRDGFFRGLKDIAVGDRVEVASGKGFDVYRVDSLRVVSPGDAAPLQPTSDDVLTLVTCYPFFYLGPAPQRFIVRASLQSHAAPNQHS
ncbi:sortase A [Bryocella elongata]|uniref:Sortase A n=1 Tax=Bryocella elongata TaxID=863522 RepID=A0A1H5YRS5_9BACT|nr:class D sortase [Bryocella elongata]SEG26026.1 sortase A [Bryocella elongata]